MKTLFLILALFMSLSAHAEPDCQVSGTVCSAGPETRNIGGTGVFRECWEYTDTYQCRSQAQINDCAPLRAKGCAQIGSVCVSQTGDGYCTSWEQSYSCPDKAESYTERTVCESSSFCQSNGMGCFDTSHPTDKDFGKAAAMIEVQRQAGVYGVDPDKIEIFKGYEEQCSIKVLGGTTLKSCCDSQGGGAGFTNFALLGPAVNVAKEGGREAVALGSKYVYDSLYGQLDSKIVDKGLSAMNNWAQGLGDGVFNPQFGFYGFTFEFSMANGFQFVGFDPYSFAFAIAMMMVQQYLSCDQSEQVMSMKRGQNLCVHLETYCSSKVLGVCIEKKEKHCCFNSKLAKIINRQGRAQLGMAMNSCGGFNQQQLQALDFSSIDLSEFIADMMPKDVNSQAMTQQAEKTINEKVKGYYEQ